MASPLITKHRSGFKNGYTFITRDNEFFLNTGMEFGIYVVSPHQTISIRSPKESVWLLLDGRITVTFKQKSETVERHSLFDEGPTLLHLGPNEEMQLETANDRAEFAVARTPNPNPTEHKIFHPPTIFHPNDTQNELRGKSLVQNAAVRIVRTILDVTIRAQSMFTVGEVVTFPGCWSSYPPHSHPQPEIYHYRFSHPNGYGHAELGSTIFNVSNFDTLKILNNQTHAQVAAPGYAMYYVWIIRHLKNNPYTGFKVDPKHQWTLSPDTQGWIPPTC